MPQLPDEIRESLESVYGPVEATFTINQIPRGGAPEVIKEQWLGVPLPVRAVNLGEVALKPSRDFDYLRQVISENDNPITIAGIEAVHALREAGKDSAADFWDAYQLGSFVFRADEGLLEAVDLSE